MTIALPTFLFGLTLAVPIRKRDTYYGVATYFYQDGNQGSCGQYSSDNDYIVAISQDSPFYYNEYCYSTVTITNDGGGDDNYGAGTTITATVLDTCPSCDVGHLDLSTGAFSALTGGNLDPPGEFNIEWYFN